MTRVDRDKEKFAGNVPNSRLLVSANWKIRYSADNETFKVHPEIWNNNKGVLVKKLTKKLFQLFWMAYL